MHFCLTVPEIVRFIVEEACTASLQRSMLDETIVDTRTAYALAMTCRTFLGSALDVLWTCQRDLNVFTSCMPGIFPEREDTGTATTVMQSYFHDSPRRHLLVIS